MKRSGSRKLNICVICGGVSPEHVVSVASSASVTGNLDRGKYNVCVIGIGREKGEWRYYGDNKFYTADENIDSHRLKDTDWKPVIIKPGEDPVFYYQEGDSLMPIEIDAFFPVIHGDNSEDGKLQGLIECMGYRIVGCGTLSSAIGMDKNITKVIAQYNSIPVVPWFSYTHVEEINVGEIVAKLGLPVFVKPCSSGSSFGITKVKDKNEITKAVSEALKYSDMVLIEKAINAREIEVAVLGHWNTEVKTSVPGEIIPHKEFYNYEAKYVDKVGADLVIPAKIEEKTKRLTSDYAKSIFKALKGSGLSRIDFLLDIDTGSIYFNEVNTIPGFTVISMYSKLWKATGIPYSKLLDELINVSVKESWQGEPVDE